jgi:hypothetical protein
MPIGAEAIGSGYEIAWKFQGQDLYTVWNVDSSGNYTSNAIGAVAVAGASSALEAFETSFHQDLNGDGVIGIPASTSSLARPQSAAEHSGQNFDGQTLTLTTPSTFEDHLIGFGASSGDQIDLLGLDFSAMHSSFDSATSKLAVTDRSTNVQLPFLGHYAQDSFHFADDGSGGTLVTSPAGPAQGTANAFSASGHDTFVFAPNFGQVSIANFIPATDSITFSLTVFSGPTALVAAIHDDRNGNAVITDAAHDTITLQHVTTAQLLTHLADFHII